MDINQAATLARGLMLDHGLLAWRFEFDQAKRRAGVCKYGRKVIGLSYHYVKHNGEAEVTDTILHEIAHALTGYKAAHGPAWKAMCLQIGANPVRCYDAKKVIMPAKRWRANCPSCPKVFKRDVVRTKNGRYYFCPSCGPKEGRLKFVANTLIPLPPEEPTFTLFDD